MRSVFLVAALAAATSAPAFDRSVSLEVLGTYESGIFDEGAAEIVAYDAPTRRAFVVNANDQTVDVLDISDPSQPALFGSIDVTQAAPDLGPANSVDVAKGILAVAIENDDKQANGIVAFYDTSSLALLGTVAAGALPDMVTFTKDGKTALVANEGEPNDEYTVDPEGSVTIIDLSDGVSNATARTADFRRFNSKKDKLIAAGVRIFGPNATVAQDLEPEYIALNASEKLAYVVMQEANAIAVVNVRRARVVRILPLGTKDHSLPGNELDASNRDDAINITNWPVQGLYLPDAIASFNLFGKSYFLTANEGDSRDYDGFSEEERVEDVTLDPNAFPNAAELQDEANLGRLKITNTLGDADGDGRFEELYSYGGRSFSIFDARGNLVFDSGSDFEYITAAFDADNFNSTNDENDSFDNRSDDKGPEPEGVTVGWIWGRAYAFVGFERVGGIAVYDVTNPHAPRFETYVNNRDFSVADPTDPAVGDLGPEGLRFVPWYLSPNYRPLLIVGNEVSGTTTIYQVGVSFGR